MQPCNDVTDSVAAAKIHEVQVKTGICSRRRIILLDDLLKKKKLTNLRTVEGLHPLLSVFYAAQFGAIKTKEAQ